MSNIDQQLYLLISIHSILVILVLVAVLLLLLHRGDDGVPVVMMVMAMMMMMMMAVVVVVVLAGGEVCYIRPAAARARGEGKDARGQSAARRMHSCARCYCAKLQFCALAICVLVCFTKAHLLFNMAGKQIRGHTRLQIKSIFFLQATFNPSDIYL